MVIDDRQRLLQDVEQEVIGTEPCGNDVSLSKVMMDVLLHLLEAGLSAFGEVAIQDDVVGDVLLLFRHLIVIGRVEEQSELMGSQTVSGIVVEIVLLFPKYPKGLSRTSRPSASAIIVGYALVVVSPSLRV